MKNKKNTDASLGICLVCTLSPRRRTYFEVCIIQKISFHQNQFGNLSGGRLLWLYIWVHEHPINIRTKCRLYYFVLVFSLFQSLTT